MTPMEELREQAAKERVAKAIAAALNSDDLPEGGWAEITTQAAEAAIRAIPLPAPVAMSQAGSSNWTVLHLALCNIASADPGSSSEQSLAHDMALIARQAVAYWNEQGVNTPTETLTAAEDETPCPVCGNEERGQGGYLSCECPAVATAAAPDDGLMGRYREALQHIALMGYAGAPDIEMRRIAREALSTATGDEGGE